MGREIVVATVLTLLLGSMLFSATAPVKGQGEVHDLEVSLSTSSPSIIRGIYNHLSSGNSTILNATVTNNGAVDEFNVGLQLLINDTLVLNALTPTLAVNHTFWTAYFWNPSDDDYNLTVYSPPVTDENNTANNKVTNWARVCPDMRPTVNFDATWFPQYPPPGPIENQTVTFDASNSNDPDWGTILNYTWNFDDGNITTVPYSNITHTYTKWRNCTVTLTLLDTENLTNSTSKNITIYARPIASFVNLGSLYVNQTVIFNAAGSYDPDNNATPTKGIALYNWDFGDGNSTSSPNSTTSHNYTAAGDYPVTLNVTDYDGLVSDNITKWLNISLGRPIASFSVQGLRYVGYNLTFDASSSHDPDNDTGPPTHGIAAYYWDFGDNKTATKYDSTVPHSYQDPGDYNVTLIVTDSDQGLNGSVSSLTSISYEVFVEVVDNASGTADIVHDPGEYFTVNITVSNVTDLFSYYVSLIWPGTGEYPIFDETTVKTGGFLAQGATEDFEQGLSLYQGYVNVTSVRVDTRGVNGSGTLAMVTFHVNSTMPGNCTLTIRYSLLRNSINGTIKCTTANGTFYTRKPVASFTFLPPKPAVNTTVQFDASRSYCPDGGNIVSYYWDFGDNETETGMTPSHEYAHSGTFDVSLTVTDDKSNETSIAHPVEVVAGPDVDVTGIYPDEIQFNNTLGLYETAGALPIDVTVTNYENATSATFNVTVYFNDTHMDTQLITDLLPGENKTIPFNCEIYGIAKGVYAINVRAWCKNYTDEWYKPMHTDGSVKVWLAGDVNRDDVTDILDAIIISNHFGAKRGDPNYYPPADLNCDGTIDILDGIILSNNFNRKDP